ncbi:uncharacterized protein F4817DRAFT_358535 [Daldinia loculata]|uniref:uncharacterized protein n=1 Tax=Daldinia loculata TaxID=103429 RepID=UPI0020C5772C|nr:uncharacterized protein F4817DRAFT_358535 [Daldinia loculata]KAI1647733.1 hypothetical protein F4817DRAFT_358535 [Daldinia loculata]
MASNEQILPSPTLNLLVSLGLTWTKSQKTAYLETIRTITLPRLNVIQASAVENRVINEPYLHRDDFLTETPAAKLSWDAYWEETYLRKPTARALRQNVIRCHPHQWKYIIQPNESVIIRDEHTNKIVLIVLRDLVPHQSLASAMEDVCVELATKCPFERQDDPGTLVHFAYTCGSRQNFQIQLATPKRGPNMGPNYELQSKAQGVAGLLWNMLRCRLPDEIIDDFNDTVHRHHLPRMDMMKAPDTSFAFEIGSRNVRFPTGTGADFELPPPSGLISYNYARYTHNEVNANNWVIGYTTHAPDDHTKGGNFYLAQYGVLLLPASNTAWSWQPTDHHGTTLFEMTDIGENDSIGCSERRLDGQYNVGLLFEISKALPTARFNTSWLPEMPRTPSPSRLKLQTNPKAVKARRAKPKTVYARVSNEMCKKT